MGGMIPDGRLTGTTIFGAGRPLAYCASHG